jgi:hypothetical protein
MFVSQSVDANITWRGDGVVRFPAGADPGSGLCRPPLVFAREMRRI